MLNALTDAANLRKLSEIESRDNYVFEHVDLSDFDAAPACPEMLQTE
jgi:hypothetical protein